MRLTIYSFDDVCNMQNKFCEAIPYFLPISFLDTIGWNYEAMFLQILDVQTLNQFNQLFEIEHDIPNNAVEKVLKRIQQKLPQHLYLPYSVKALPEQFIAIINGTWSAPEKSLLYNELVKDSPGNNSPKVSPNQKTTSKSFNEESVIERDYSEQVCRDKFYTELFSLIKSKQGHISTINLFESLYEASSSLPYLFNFVKSASCCQVSIFSIQPVKGIPLDVTVDCQENTLRCSLSNTTDEIMNSLWFYLDCDAHIPIQNFGQNNASLQDYLDNVCKHSVRHGFATQIFECMAEQMRPPILFLVSALEDIQTWRNRLEAGYGLHCIERLELSERNTYVQIHSTTVMEYVFQLFENEDAALIVKCLLKAQTLQRKMVLANIFQSISSNLGIEITSQSNITHVSPNTRIYMTMPIKSYLFKLQRQIRQVNCDINSLDLRQQILAFNACIQEPVESLKLSPIIRMQLLTVL